MHLFKDYNKPYPQEYLLFLKKVQKSQGMNMAAAVTRRAKETPEIGRSQGIELRSHALRIIKENAVLLSLAGEILEKDRALTLREEIHDHALNFIDSKICSTAELVELYNTIPQDILGTDCWIYLKIIQRLTAHNDLLKHTWIAWKQVRKSSREFPSAFIWKFWKAYKENT